MGIHTIVGSAAAMKMATESGGAGGFLDGKLCLSEVGMSKHLFGDSYANEIEIVKKNRK